MTKFGSYYTEIDEYGYWVCRCETDSSFFIKGPSELDVVGKTLEREERLFYQAIQTKGEVIKNLNESRRRISACYAVLANHKAKERAKKMLSDMHKMQTPEHGEILQICNTLLTLSELIEKKETE